MPFVKKDSKFLQWPSKDIDYVFYHKRSELRKVNMGDTGLKSEAVLGKGRPLEARAWFFSLPTSQG